MEKNSLPLQTLVPLPDNLPVVSYDNRLFLLGSCFTDYMAQQLSLSGFSVLANPFGILYNPFSMAECLHRCLEQREIGEEDLVFHDGLWHAWSHHGAFSSPDRQQCLDACNNALVEAGSFLQHADTLLLTFGTSWLYQLQSDGRVVANCHKLPSATFRKRMASVQEIVSLWQPLLSRWQGRVIITISPIRHWADGAHGNQLSKSTLLLAAEQLGQHYFPAYEIMMDQLRDYRFYADDMLHPSPLAQQYIWQQFQQCVMTDSTRQRCALFQQLHTLQSHRPLHPDSEAALQHVQRVAELQRQLYPESHK